MVPVPFAEGLGISPSISIITLTTSCQGYKSFRVDSILVFTAIHQWYIRYAALCQTRPKREKRACL